MNPNKKSQQITNKIILLLKANVCGGMQVYHNLSVEKISNYSYIIIVSTLLIQQLLFIPKYEVRHLRREWSSTGRRDETLIPQTEKGLMGTEGQNNRLTWLFRVRTNFRMQNW